MFRVDRTNRRSPRQAALARRLIVAGRGAEPVNVTLAALAGAGLGFVVFHALLGTPAEQAAGSAVATGVAGGLVRILLTTHRHANELERRQTDHRQLYLSTVRCLAAAIDARDYYSREHVLLVENAACKIAEAMNLPPDRVEGIRTAALLLDVGTLGIPENILLHPGRPSPREFATIHNHPIIGSQILEGVPFPWPVQRAIRAHHERWDGSGYPDRLHGRDIPLEARILAVADVYSSLTCNRTYRSSWTHVQAVEHIHRMAGVHFDPEVVAAFDRAAPYILDIRTLPDSYLAEHVAYSIARANQQFVAMWEIAQSANSSIELNGLLEAVARKIAEVLPCDGCAIFLLEGSGKKLTCMATSSSDMAVMLGCYTNLGEIGPGRVAQDHRPQITRHIRESLYTPDGVPTHFRYAWSATAALETDSTTLGTVTLYCKDKEFSIEELDMLEALARHASLPVANASLFEATRENADRDSLTGLYNLRYFYAQMEQEISRAKRLEHTFSIIALDLNRFKAVNDTLGHVAGDALLMDIARLLTRTVRDYDVVVRYGGDEFVVVLPEASAKEAAETIARLEESVRVYTLHWPGLESIGFGASMGASTYPDDGTDIKTLLETADQRMYERKRKTGRAQDAA